MLDLFTRDVDDIEVIAGRKIEAKVAGLYCAPGDDFQTRQVDWLELSFEGIVGDYHAGTTRRSGSREPWYRRGTEIRNERQLTIVSPSELNTVAQKMELQEVRPQWIGANLLLDGVPQLSFLPAGTLLFFAGGVTLKVDGQNHPCRDAGRAIAENVGMADVKAGALLFPKMARRMRGLTAWVEKPGRIEADETVSVRVPEQWIYR